MTYPFEATPEMVKAALDLVWEESETNHDLVCRLWRAMAAVAQDQSAAAQEEVLAQFWRPISEADKSITFEQTFYTGDGKSMTIRNSDHYWVRDADGRVYEATWPDHKGGYWWDLEGESPVDPSEYMPHPLSLPTRPSGEVA